MEEVNPKNNIIVDSNTCYTQFYKQDDYLEKTRADFAQTSRVPLSYTHDTESKVYRVAKQLFSVLVFPIAIYNVMHFLIGKVLLLSSSPKLQGRDQNYASALRKDITLTGEWKYKRLTIACDGYEIDAVIFGKPSTLNNGRWIIHSCGNGEVYEENLNYNLIQPIVGSFQGNGIVFNYPGVQGSSGMPSKEAMGKAYRAVLNFLEDSEKGVGAKEIIGWGHSIGGGTQGEALKEHELKANIRYVFVKSRTFSYLSTTVTDFLGELLLPIIGKIPGFAIGKIAGLAVQFFGWNMSSVESSKNLKAPEIILQTAKVSACEKLEDSSKIIDDGVISGRSSLAKALLEDTACPQGNKKFLGITEYHNDLIRNMDTIVKQVKELLANVH